MPQLVSALVQARTIFAKHRSPIRTSDAIRLGIHPRTLYQLRDSAEIERIGRGLYRLTSDRAISNPDWIDLYPSAKGCVLSDLGACSPPAYYASPAYDRHSDTQPCPTTSH